MTIQELQAVSEAIANRAEQKIARRHRFTREESAADFGTAVADLLANPDHVALYPYHDVSALDLACYFAKEGWHSAERA